MGIAIRSYICIFIADQKQGRRVLV